MRTKSFDLITVKLWTMRIKLLIESLILQLKDPVMMLLLSYVTISYFNKGKHDRYFQKTILSCYAKQCRFKF